MMPRLDARYKLTGDEWQVAKAEMRAALIGTARERKTITYSELALAMPTYVFNPGSYVFMRILAELCREEDEAGRGMICALVVSKQTGIPGAGFFRGLAEWGRDVSEMEAAWHDECERVYAVWAE